MPKPQLHTAIIAVAGWGTRWLPLSKAIEKCMIPVGTRPVIDWIVADCVRAGVDRIIFVVGEEQTQIRQYYSHNAPLDAYLTAKNKPDQLTAVRQPQYDEVHFEFVVQPNNGHYGTAIPLLFAADKLAPREPFLYFMGDDFVYRTDGGNEISDLIAAWQSGDAESAIMVSEVPREAAPNYGVVISDEQGRYQEILERPTLEAIAHIDRPTINISKYIFDAAMVHFAVQYAANKPSDQQEYYVTDVINQAVTAGHKLLVHRHSGEYLDAGTPSNWLHANNVVMGM